MPGSSCDARRPSGDAAANSSPTLRPVASDDDRYGDCPIRRPSRRSTVEPSGASRAGTTSSSAARFARRRFGIGTWAQGGNAEPTNRTRAFESIRARPHRPRPQARHCCPVADQQYERDCWIGLDAPVSTPRAAVAEAAGLERTRSSQASAAAVTPTRSVLVQRAVTC